ncbi:formate--tetrahydrofolate ligase [Prevotella nigrescens]|jgi:formate--tetrahydrofolate ligase|uniref:Formate--tetrahydrofolate ligase n=1 Tax=Prevotella nigrescens TaxID=28133 RepID=A0A9D5WU09_9BACT|nr:formate--tetrahydrofolate ligase [Prevotella nigrescens]EGQ17956.1 formate-tetrahydrofolate ligase [Prevotella nigrescens ATCC 33563]MBF1446265.1 formate--tetrahydrofolate ligase [Prevotella nigrescens]QUB52682.1 formate--tetrahydrofolate ligase [Prevotella nigrescens]UAK28878.1 formate--tetrahydrofolate ligase [Prevotella nigrescens]WMS22001.1 formate--tetrahydrofolate ligase [Prevotella nigrescens]
MKTDFEIAHEAKLELIDSIAKKANIPTDEIEPFGKHIAKVPYRLIDEEKVKKSKLILVTAITPTKAGIGKTTVSVGLALGMNRIGKNAIPALREPSLGPCFGMKGGAAGGGYAQVLPMEKINLHFTGDFHAITSANNMISALLDNYLYQHQDDGFGMKEIWWRRVLDVNDRNLRTIITGLGGRTDGLLSESGFDITPASEIMAILCLASDEEDLYRRLDNIILGITLENKPLYLRDLNVTGSIVALLHEAINPNLVQTIENTPAFIHGGPFANIAHGCNSILATKMAMSCSDYCITEAGFGADLGAEKFLDIKCRKAGISPVLTVLVATAQALKMHGGIDVAEISKPNVEGLKAGLPNLDKHIANLKAFGQTVVVCLNRFATDTDEELALVKEHCEAQGVGFAINTAFGEGGKGAEELAHLVVDTIEKKPSAPLNFVYEENDDIVTKVEKIAKKIYGAGKVVLRPAAKRDLQRIKELGFENFPVCIAKTQYSFSEDAKAYGVPTDFTITIRDFVINAGAGMIVAIAGTIMRMPGLPKKPQAENIHVVNGVIEGLS